jgi:hypothetical protein
MDQARLRFMGAAFDLIALDRMFEAGCSTIDAKRRMADACGCDAEVDVGSQFVYGEVDTIGFAALLQWLSETYDLGDAPKYTDLGSGTGRWEFKWIETFVHSPSAQMR